VFAVVASGAWSTTLSAPRSGRCGQCLQQVGPKDNPNLSPGEPAGGTGHLESVQGCASRRDQNQYSPLRAVFWRNVRSPRWWRPVL